MAQITRRRLLSGAAGTTLALITGCASRSRSEPVAAPSVTPAAETTNLAPDEIIITPTDQFYTTFWNVPSVGVDIDTWRLEIDGLVDNPISLSYDELLALPAVEEMRTLECIGNPVGGDLIGNAVWKGFYLEQLLTEVGVQDKAIRAQFAAADGYWTSVDLQWITQPGVLMAYEMNGEPLSPKHGHPLRILMPGLYGQKMPKWITQIHFTDEIVEGYWEGQGWSDVAAVKTNSQIWQPRDLDKLSVAAGEIVVYGLAYAAPREIVKVELGIGAVDLPAPDSTGWIETELLKGPSVLTWTQWSAVWRASPGNHVLGVRATDSQGLTQISGMQGVLQGAFPDGVDAVHDIVVTVEAG
jgi:DMSO/TMAO reductase YedYZ molybdopterin-dependent catalytic subunit